MIFVNKTNEIEGTRVSHKRELHLGDVDARAVDD